jgi:AcrR family transcriptional regulator
VTNDEASCKRPYALDKRQAQSDRNREAVLDAARALLETGDSPKLTMESIAQASGVTRQTVHNLFKTRAGVLEALFDRIAVAGGMTGMQSAIQAAMRQTSPAAIVDGYVRTFAQFWSKDRVLIRRIHGIGATDREVGAAVAARNQRRWKSANRIIDRLSEIDESFSAGDRARNLAALYAMTSFEFFDVLAEGLKDPQEAETLLLTLVHTALHVNL